MCECFTLYTYYGTLKAQTATTTGTPRQSGLHWFFSAAFTSGRVTKAELKFGLASHAFTIFLWEGLYFNVVGTIPLTS